MTSRVNTNLLRILAIVLVLTILLSSFEEAIWAKNQQETAPLVTNNVFLPVSMKNYPQTRIFGAQVVNLGDTTVTDLAKDSGLYWARIDAFDWSKIEPQNTNPSTYLWHVVDEESLKAASENNIEVIAIVRNTPTWAQKYPPYTCGPISEAALSEFADFLGDLVKRYSVSPYNIKYWELGNEPDASRNHVAPNSVFGCWGDKDEAFYGGEIYADMLNVAYPAIKSADPEAKVVIGGLLLDCDYTHPIGGGKCDSSLFLEGILRNGDGNNFDFVNFHGYAPYAGPSTGVGSLYYDEHLPKWEHRGGVVLGKIDFLHFAMGRYGIDKPIFHTEGSLICPEQNTTDCAPPGAAFYEAQADYVVWLYARNLAEGIIGTIWYQFEGPGWRYGGLLDDAQNPRPAYDALKFITEELDSASYTGLVTQFPNLKGYEFKSDVKKIWVLWAPDQKPYTITLPSSINHVYDKYGVEIILSNYQVTVNSPIYAEFDN